MATLPPTPTPHGHQRLDFFPLGTPPHPEFPSGHSMVSGAAAAILAGIFGDDTASTVTSDVRAGTRQFSVSPRP
jgi:membrane-associated phospholipid phosphatase